jgi:hypothetical protein
LQPEGVFVAILTVTNLTTSPIWLNDLYTNVNPGAQNSVITERDPAQIPNMEATMALAAAGQISVSVSYNTGELDSGLMTQLQGVPVSITPPAVGQTLVYNGTDYLPAAGGGGAGSNFFVYRDSEPSPTGNIYATFAGAYAAAIATGVQATIGIDTSLNVGQVYAGAYDLSKITLSGVNYINNIYDVLLINDGVTFTAMNTITNYCVVLLEFSVPTNALITATNNQLLFLENDGVLVIDNTGRFYDLSGGYELIIFIGEYCYFEGDSFQSQCIWLGSNGTAYIYIDTYSTITNDVVGGTGGSVQIDANSLAASFPTTMPYFSGSLNYQFPNQAAYLQPYISNGGPSGVPWIQTGTMYYDTGTNQPYWWNGSAWISATIAPRSLLYGVSGSSQTSNIGVGDHIIFNSSTFQQGSDITLDTSTPYTTTLGAASIGRITLAANHSYKLTSNIVQVSNGSVYYQWFDATNGAFFGSGTRLDPSGGTDNAAHSDVVGIYTTSGSSILIEVQLAFVGGITAIGEAAATNLYPWFIVEEIA